MDFFNPNLRFQEIVKMQLFVNTPNINMQYLYISALSSERIIKQIHEQTCENPGFAVQKFSRLLVKGFVANNVDIQTLSAIPISTKRSKKLFWNENDEVENGVKYSYIPFLNIPILRHICLSVYTFFYVLFWGLKDRKNRCIICDVLNVSICISAVWAAKLIRLRRVGVVTDIPGLMMGQSKKSFMMNAIVAVNKSYLSSFTHYILLTEQMNEVVNLQNMPYIVMEGLADVDMKDSVELKMDKQQPKVLMYAGGLHERYGLKMLVEAFTQLDTEEWNLIIYGSGSYAEELKKCKDSRVIYKGVVPNDEVVRAEFSASLLVNPRPTHEDFTKYSFPSKNIEYMVSGTPLLTTRLPGMPQEYSEYVYLFDEETVEGYRKKLSEIFSLTATELSDKGESGREFILTHKNNVVQTGRIIDFMCQNV